MKYLRLWRRFIVIGALRMLEYRFNFTVTVLAGLVELILAVLTFELIYQFTPTVSGWPKYDALMLLGFYRVVNGIIGAFVSPNMRAITEHVRRGDMDFILLWPVSSRFIVSTRQIETPEVVTILTGTALAIWAAAQAGMGWSALAIGEAALLLACGVLMLYNLWLFIMTFSFWLVNIDMLDYLFHAAMEAARYPVSFFKGAVRKLLTFIVPVAFATTFPAQAIRGSVQAQMLLLGVFMAALSLGLTQLFWNYAVRHYSSASS